MNKLQPREIVSLYPTTDRRFTGWKQALPLRVTAQGPRLLKNALRQAVKTWNAAVGKQCLIIEDSSSAYPVSCVWEESFGDVIAAAFPAYIAINPHKMFHNGGKPVIVVRKRGQLRQSYDLCALLVHELGHALGLNDTTEENSCMGWWLVWRVPQARDVELLRALYK